MACTEEYISFVCRQLNPLGEIATRKMMGDYVIYINGKCVVTVCDNVCYVKMHPSILPLMQDAEKGFPYDCAKEHYILDIEHKDVCLPVAGILAEVLPYPKKRSKGKGK